MKRRTARMRMRMGMGMRMGMMMMMMMMMIMMRRRRSRTAAVAVVVKRMTTSMQYECDFGGADGHDPYLLVSSRLKACSSTFLVFNGNIKYWEKNRGYIHHGAPKTDFCRLFLRLWAVCLAWRKGHSTNVSKQLQDSVENFRKHHLVGGWKTPLQNMSLSVGMIIPNILEKSAKRISPTATTTWKSQQKCVGMMFESCLR